MALLQKLKSLLGFGGSDSERKRSREIGVTVERDGAVDDGNGAGAGTPRERTEDVHAEPPQSGTADTADESSTQTADAEAAATPDAADSAVAVEPESEPEQPVETEATVDAAPDAADDSDSEPEQEPEPVTEAEADPDPVTEIKGIGPAYADRLAGADVETVGELAVADAAELADQTDISEKRIQGWIERAEVR